MALGHPLSKQWFKSMKLINKQVIYPVIVLIIFSVVAAGLMLNKQEQQKVQPKLDPISVDVMAVKLAPHQFQVKSQGTVAPRVETMLVAQVSGEVVTVSSAFVKGGMLNAGDVLAQIDPFDYEVKLEQAKANLAGARASFILESAQGRVAEAEWAKVSKAEPSELGLRKPQQEQALAAVKAAQASLKQAQKDLERTTITVPYDALVEARHVSLGSFVSKGAVVANIYDTQQAEIRLPVSQRDASYLDIKQGAKVGISAQVRGQEAVWSGTLLRSEGMIDIESRMMHVVAGIDAPYQIKRSGGPVDLPFGTYITAVIQGRTLDSAVSVPRQAIRNRQVPLFVNGKLVFRNVTVERHEGRFSIISEGLQEGDLLITSPLERATEGLSLKLISTAKTTGDK